MKEKKNEAAENRQAASDAYFAGECEEIMAEAKSPLETRLSKLCSLFQQENEALKRELSLERFLWIMGILLVFSAPFSTPFDIVAVFLVLVLVLVTGLAKKFHLPYAENMIDKCMDMVSLWLERRK